MNTYSGILQDLSYFDGQPIFRLQQLLSVYSPSIKLYIHLNQTIIHVHVIKVNTKLWLHVDHRAVYLQMYTIVKMCLLYNYIKILQRCGRVTSIPLKLVSPSKHLTSWTSGNVLFWSGQNWRPSMAWWRRHHYPGYVRYWRQCLMSERGPGDVRDSVQFRPITDINSYLQWMSWRRQDFGPV